MEVYNDPFLIKLRVGRTLKYFVLQPEPSQGTHYQIIKPKLYFGYILSLKSYWKNTCPYKPQNGKAAKPNGVSGIIICVE